MQSSYKEFTWSVCDDRRPPDCLGRRMTVVRRRGTTASKQVAHKSMKYSNQQSSTQLFHPFVPLSRWSATQHLARQLWTGTFHSCYVSGTGMDIHWIIWYLVKANSACTCNESNPTGQLRATMRSRALWQSVKPVNKRHWQAKRAPPSIRPECGCHVLLSIYNWTALISIEKDKQVKHVLPMITNEWW